MEIFQKSNFSLETTFQNSERRRRQRQNLMSDRKRAYHEKDYCAEVRWYSVIVIGAIHFLQYGDCD